MSRFKLYIEYEGTRYSGWQKQQNSKTIQGTLIKAAEEIFGSSNLDLQGSGRTDSGVHALCQVAHLEVKTMLAPEIMKYKFNDKLPHDINILEIEKAGLNFHARHDAVSRSYIYQICRRRTAFGKNYVWWIKDKLNFKKMQDASKEFTGMHDFSSFAEEDKLEKSTKVLIENIQIKEEGELILIRITGSHFLWKMVRRMTGILAEIGRGNMSASDLKELLSRKSDIPAKYTAPPSGLYLEKVLYKGDDLPKELCSTFFVTKFKSSVSRN
ncbi:MAG: tRNA pseudouridine(38-40) synthase TruA [Ignavibacteriaceae bacterium]|jgi:tRNA pseudouridine38-40 synthase